MKIIDRYVLVTFIKNYLISFMVLIGMYIALDMVFNFASLTQSSTQTGLSISFFRILYDIGDFYFYQSFVFFVHLSGIIAVVAAGFTLMRLSRFNELTALLASGIPLLRIALSIVIAGAALNLVLLPIDQELLIPAMIPKLMREHRDVHETNERIFAVRMMQDEDGSLFNAAMYSPPTTDSPARIKDLDVIEREAQTLRPIAHLSADEAVWNQRLQQWDLTGGQLAPVGPEGNAASPLRNVAVYKSDINPEQIQLNLSKDFVQFLSTAELDALIAKPKVYGTINLARTKHLRFTQPLINIILLLLAIPAVLTREPGKLKTAAARCMFFTGLCMAVVFLAYQLAGSPPQAAWSTTWPALMAWLPIFIFGPLAVFLLDRVKT